MACQETGTAAVVKLAAEIDLTNSERACGQLDAAIACGAAVVVADLTATRFCDCASLRRLLAVQRRAAASGVQLRFVMPSGSPVRRLAGLTGLDEPLHIYPSVREATAWLRGPGYPGSGGLARRPGVGGELKRGIDRDETADAGQLGDPAHRPVRGDDEPQLHAGPGGLAVGQEQVPQASGITEAGAGQIGDDDRDAGRQGGGDQGQDLAGVGDVDLGRQADDGWRGRRRRVVRHIPQSARTNAG